MRDIYASAERVWIWLGEEGDGSDTTFDALPVITGQIHGHDDDDEEQKQHQLHLTQQCAGLFFELANRRPWFSRTWILQELAVCERDPLVVCGRNLCHGPH